MNDVNEQCVDYDEYSDYSDPEVRVRVHLWGV